MSDETFISENAALHILMGQGDFTHSQARIVLAHSRKQGMGGAIYYPMAYIYMRADANIGRQED